MRIDVKKALSNKITIINRLKKADSATGIDVWYKKTLANCFWDVAEHSDQSGTVTSIGASIRVQIPQNQSQAYKPYAEWKDAPDSSWTVSVDDFVVLGDVSETLTAQNIVATLKKYEPNCCKIRVFEDLTNKNGAKVSGFLGNFANIYYIEGV